MNNDPNTEVIPETAIENTTPMQSASTPPPQKKRSLRLIIGGGIVAALILLGGGGALAYTLYYQNPDKVVHDAILNVLTAKTITTTGKVTYKDEGVSVDISLDSRANQTEGEFNINAKVALDTAGMQQDFEASGSGRMVDDTLYFKLDGVKEIVDDVASESQGAIPPYAAAIIEKIDDRWISVKASDYQSFYEDLAEQQACLTNLTEKVRSDKDITNELTSLYGKHKIVTIKEELKSKSINGVGSLGYKIGINEDATASFVRGLERTKLGNELQNCDEDIDFSQMADDLDRETQGSEYTPTMELWVSRFGHEVTEFSIYGDTSESGNLSIVLQPTFNEDVTIETPADAVSFETVMEDIRSVISEYNSEMYPQEETMQMNFENELDLQSAV